MLVTVIWHDPDMRSKIVKVRDRSSEDDYFLKGILNQAMRQYGYTEEQIHTQHYVRSVEFVFQEKPPRFKKVCSKCKGTDIRVDAWASWSETEQDWVLANMYEDTFCNDCEEACDIEDKEITP